MKIDVTLNDNSELSFTVLKESFTIGRSPQCEVVIPHEGISRKHCQISYKDGDLYIEDLGSVNGVYIDGKKIASNTPTKFQTFLSVSFGSVQSLRIELDDNMSTGPIAGSVAAVTASANKTSPSITRSNLKIERPDRTGKIKKTVADDHGLTRTRVMRLHPKKKKGLNPLVVILSAGILAAGIYLFMEQENTPVEPEIDNIPYYEKKDVK